MKLAVEYDYSEGMLIPWAVYSYGYREAKPPTPEMLLRTLTIPIPIPWRTYATHILAGGVTWETGWHFPRVYFGKFGDEVMLRGLMCPWRTKKFSAA